MNNSNIQKISNDLRRLPVLYSNVFGFKDDISLANVYDFKKIVEDLVNFKRVLESEINSLTGELFDEYKDKFNKLVDFYREPLNAINEALNTFSTNFDAYKLNNSIKEIISNIPSNTNLNDNDFNVTTEISEDNNSNDLENGIYDFFDSNESIDFDSIPILNTPVNNEIVMPTNDLVYQEVPSLNEIDSNDTSNDSSTSDDSMFEEVSLDNDSTLGSSNNTVVINEEDVQDNKQEEVQDSKQEEVVTSSDINIKEDINEILNQYNKVISDIDNYNIDSYSPTYVLYNDVLKLNYDIAKVSNEVSLVNENVKSELESLLNNTYTNNMKLVVEDINNIIATYRKDYNNIKLLDYLLKNLDRRTEQSLSESTYNKNEEIYKEFYSKTESLYESFKKVLIDDIDNINFMNEETVNNYFHAYNRFLDKDKEIRNRLSSLTNNSEIEKISDIVNKFWNNKEVNEYYHYVQEIYKEYSAKAISYSEAGRAIKALKSYKDAIKDGKSEDEVNQLLNSLTIESWAIIGKKYNDFVNTYSKQEVTVEENEEKKNLETSDEISTKLMSIRDEILTSLDRLAIIDNKETEEFIAHFNKLDNYINDLEKNPNKEVQDVIERFFKDLINKLLFRTIKDFSNYYNNTKDNATFVNYGRSVLKLIESIKFKEDKDIKKDAYEVINSYKKHIGKEPVFKVDNDFMDYVKGNNSKIVDIDNDAVKFVETTTIPVVDDIPVMNNINNSEISEADAKALYDRLIDFKDRYNKEYESIASKNTTDKTEFEVYKLSLLVDLKPSYDLNEKYLLLFESPTKISVEDYNKIYNDNAFRKEHSDLIDIDKKVNEILGLKLKEELSNSKKKDYKPKEEKQTSILDKFVNKINDIKAKVFKVTGTLSDKAKKFLKDQKRAALTAAFASLAIPGVVGLGSSVINANNPRANETSVDDEKTDETIKTVDESKNEGNNTAGDTIDNPIEAEDPVIIDGEEYGLEKDITMGEITIGDYVVKTNPRISSSMYQESTSHAYFDDEPSIVIGVVYANHENDVRFVAKTIEECKNALEHGGYPVMYKVVNAKIYEQYAGSIDDINKIVEGYLDKEDVMEVSPNEVSELLEIGRSMH